MFSVALETLLDRFPLGFAIDREGAFAAVGRTLTLRWGLRVGDCAAPHFAPIGQRADAQGRDLIAALGAAADSGAQMRLQLEPSSHRLNVIGAALRSHQLIVFLGTLAPEHASDLSRTGLAIGDFGPTEVLPSFAMMATVNAINLADAKALNVRMEQALYEQNRLRKELEAHNAQLEATVAVRTRLIEAQSLELRAALEAQQEANALQRNFVSMASHEFRTPLAIIDGSAYSIERRLRRGAVEPEVLARKLADIRRGVSRTIMVMESLLAAARAEEAGFTPALATLAPAPIIEQLCRDHAYASPSHSVRLDASAAPAEMRVDASALTHIVSNLISNAIKYSPNTDVIDVNICADERDLIIAVEDYGVGIPENEMGRLLERFYRASTATGIAGTGIGLHLVKILVESHDGRIEIRSRVGEGTRFLVRLPLNGPPKAAPCIRQDGASLPERTEEPVTPHDTTPPPGASALTQATSEHGQ